MGFISPSHMGGLLMEPVWIQMHIGTHLPRSAELGLTERAGHSFGRELRYLLHPLVVVFVTRGGLGSVRLGLDH